MNLFELFAVISLDNSGFMNGLKDASGAAIKDCVTYEMTAMKIVTTDLKKGTYTLTFKRFDEQLTLTLKMGMK